MVTKVRLAATSFLALVGTLGIAHAAPVVPPPPPGALGTAHAGPVTPPLKDAPVAQLSVSLAPAKTRASNQPLFAVDGNDVYALLGSLPDWNVPGYPIYVAHSTDGGASFAPAVKVIEPAHFSTRRGAIAAKNGVVVVSWVTEAAVSYAISTNKGASFSAPVRLAAGVSVGGYGVPIMDIAFTTTGPVAVWQTGSPVPQQTDSTARVHFGRLTPTGVVGQIQVNREPYAAVSPSLGVDGSHVVVSFVEDQNPMYFLSIAESLDEGKSWSQIANAAEGNPGTALSDSERAAARFPSSGMSKPIYKLTSAPSIERTYVFGATTIVTIPYQGSDPETRAVVAADPNVGLFHGRSAPLHRCAAAMAPETQPLAPRDQPIFSGYERTSHLFTRTASGAIVSTWTQGFKSTAEYRSRLYAARFNGSASLTDCHMMGENADFRPVVLAASGETITVGGGTAHDAALGSFTPGAASISLRHVGAGTSFLDGAGTARGLVFGWLESPQGDGKGTPRAFGVPR